MENDLKALAQKELLRRAAMKELERRKAVQPASQASSAANAFAQNAGGIVPTQGGMAGGLQTIDDAVRGAANGVTFGVADRIAGFMGGEGTDAERAKSDQARERSPVAYTGGEITGAVAGMGKLASAGGTAARFIPQGLSGSKALIAKMLAGGADGLVLNEASNLGYGRDFGENSGLAAVAGAGAPALAQGVTALGSKALGAFNKTPQTMDAEGLKQAAQAAYGRADDAGVIYSPQAIQRVTNDLKGQFAEFGYHPELQSGAKVALGELDRISQGNTTLKGLDTARKLAGNAFQPGNKANNALTAKVTGAIDDLVQNPKSGDVLTGDASKAASAIKEARDLYGRSAKLEKVDYLLKKAGLNAGSAGSGGNIENATRQQLKTLLANPKNTRGMTADEIAATKKAVLGTPVQNALRLAGKLSPQGNGLMMALGGAGAVASPAIAIPAMAGGYLAKKGAEGITRANVKQLERLIASGGNAAALKAPKNAAQKALEARKDLIAKMLLGGALTAIPAN